MEELECLMRELENGTLTLDESIKHYKKGMELAAYCSNILQKAEQEIFILENKGFEKFNGDTKDE